MNTWSLYSNFKLLAIIMNTTPFEYLKLSIRAVVIRASCFGLGRQVLSRELMTVTELCNHQEVPGTLLAPVAPHLGAFQHTCIQCCTFNKHHLGPPKQHTNVYWFPKPNCHLQPTWPFLCYPSSECANTKTCYRANPGEVGLAKVYFVKTEV